MILLASITLVLGYLIGVNLGHERGLRNAGVLTGKDAIRFNKMVEENNRKKGSVDFTKKVEEAKKIWEKAETKKAYDNLMSIADESITNPHKAKVLSKEEVEKGRSNAYGYIKLNSVPEEQIESNRPKSAPYLFGLTPNLFERELDMERYEAISSKESYTKALKSGMFWEYWPELSGKWEEDKKIIWNILKPEYKKL